MAWGRLDLLAFTLARSLMHLKTPEHTLYGIALHHVHIAQVAGRAILHRARRRVQALFTAQHANVACRAYP
jgi:hypothetical protein